MVTGPFLGYLAVNSDADTLPDETHGNFDEEWCPHQGANDRWCTTGYLRDIKRPESLYSYQFTVINPKYFRKNIYVLHMAFTHMQTGKHSFECRVRLIGKKTRIGQRTVSFPLLAYFKENQIR